MTAHFTTIPPANVDHITVSHKGRKLSAQVLYPETMSTARPLVALHGISRDTDAFIRHFAPEATRAQRIIVVPHFDEGTWPSFQRPFRQTRPDLALLALLDGLRQRFVGFDTSVDIFGYSGGAQLAHRVAMLYPHRFADLHLGSAGWYCLPDADVPYPYGLAQGDGPSEWVSCKTALLGDFLDRQITVYVGDRDTVRDPALRQNGLVDATQGCTRLDRARTYVAAVNRAAADRGLAPRARLVTLTDCHHCFDTCATNAGLARIVAGQTPAQILTF